MRISNLSQLDYKDGALLNFDFFICASGFESRASYQALTHKGESKNKWVLNFNNVADGLIRKENDKVFEDRGFQCINLESEEIDFKIFDSLINEIANFNTKQTEINIYIDYSSMTKNWYSYLLFSFKNTSFTKNINLYFGYSHGQYTPANCNESLNRIVKPLTGFCNISVPSKPTALIICLGNEPNRVIGLTEFFDAIPFLFYSDNSYNSEFSNEVLDVNSEILNTSKSSNIFKFPVFDLVYTNYLLENLCYNLINKFRVIIAPCGPKPFSLLSMINSLKVEDNIEIWRISPGDGILEIDRKPTGLVSLLKLSLELS